MLPSYAGNGGYGSYGRRKGFLQSPSTIAAAVTVLVLGALGFATYTHFRSSSAHTAKVALQRDLENMRSELYSLKGQCGSRKAEFEQLQVTHGHTQRRLTELTGQLQRKEADLAAKEHQLQQHLQERNVIEQHRGAREAELTKMVEDLRQELLRTDGVIDALDKKIATMETVHNAREKDWHKLAGTWVKYEQDLHEQYRKCTEEVAKLRNLTAAMNDTTGPLPEAEPKLRPEADFGQINVQVPEHKAHQFAPLPPASPPPGDLPLPEPKIRDSIVQMTAGQVGLQPGETLPPAATPTDAATTTPTPVPASTPTPTPTPATPTDGQQHAAPNPTQVHHHDIYNSDFHEDDPNNHYHGHYDSYHGHYDSYDPMDQYWLKDAHGDWNADDIANEHDQNHHKQDPHQQQHDHNQHHYHQQQYPAPPAHGHASWQPHAQHGSAGSDPQQQQQQQQQQQHQEHYNQQQQQHHQAYQQYQQQQEQYQQQQQQYQQQQQHHQQHQQQQQQHNQHPYGGHGDHHHAHGDLAYKMGW